MKLFDFFKKKPIKKEEDKSKLELLLLKNKQNADYFSELFNELLENELIIITHNNEMPEGQHDLHQQSSMNIVTYPEGQIPVFTDIARIYDNNDIREQVQYIKINGLDLFTLAKGATFIINPYSDSCKEFLPAEVEQWLKEFETKSELSMEKVSDIQIGQPGNYPNEMVNRLAAFFATRREVLSAYVGWIFNQNDNKDPHYIIGIKANEDSKTLVKAACDIALEALPPTESVDIVVLNRRSKISDFLINETKPFYQRAVSTQ